MKHVSLLFEAICHSYLKYLVRSRCHTLLYFLFIILQTARAYPVVKISNAPTGTIRNAGGANMIWADRSKAYELKPQFGYNNRICERKYRLLVLYSCIHMSVYISGMVSKAMLHEYAIVSLFYLPFSFLKANPTNLSLSTACSNYLSYCIMICIYMLFCSEVVVSWRN